MLCQTCLVNFLDVVCKMLKVKFFGCCKRFKTMVCKIFMFQSKFNFVDIYIFFGMLCLSFDNYIKKKEKTFTDGFILGYTSVISDNHTDYFSLNHSQRCNVSIF